MTIDDQETIELEILILIWIMWSRKFFSVKADHSNQIIKERTVIHISPIEYSMYTSMIILNTYKYLSSRSHTSVLISFDANLRFLAIDIQFCWCVYVSQLNTRQIIWRFTKYIRTNHWNVTWIWLKTCLPLKNQNKKSCFYQN